MSEQQIEQDLISTWNESLNMNMCRAFDFSYDFYDKINGKEPLPLILEFVITTNVIEHINEIKNPKLKTLLREGNFDEASDILSMKSYSPYLKDLTFRQIYMIDDIFNMMTESQKHNFIQVYSILRSQSNMFMSYVRGSITETGTNWAVELKMNNEHFLNILSYCRPYEIGNWSLIKGGVILYTDDLPLFKRSGSIQFRVVNSYS